MAKRDSKRVIVVDDSHEPDVASVLAEIVKIEQAVTIDRGRRRRSRALA